MEQREEEGWQNLDSKQQTDEEVFSEVYIIPPCSANVAFSVMI